MPIEELESVSLIQCPPESVVFTFNAVYSGYLVPLAMTLHCFEKRFRGEDLDPFASRVWRHDKQPAALLLITRRGRASRIAALGIAPEFRGQGLGRSVCEFAIEQARARHDTEISLEVFGSNVAAHTLYRRVGFKDTSPLFGFSFSGGAPPLAGTAAAEIETQAAIRVGNRYQHKADLPWMIDPATLAAATLPTRCFVDDSGKLVAFVDDQSADVRLTGLLGSITAENAAGFMEGLCAHFPSRGWFAPAIFPTEFARSFFKPAGWDQSDLSQMRMVYAVRKSGTPVEH